MKYKERVRKVFQGGAFSPIVTSHPTHLCVLCEHDSLCSANATLFPHCGINKSSSSSCNNQRQSSSAAVAQGHRKGNVNHVTAVSLSLLQPPERGVIQESFWHQTWSIVYF